MDEQKWLSIGDELINSVKDQFPSHAVFSSTVDHLRHSYAANIYWKLGNDRARPNKPSRIIQVIISGEAIDDSQYDSRRDNMRERFVKYITSKNNQFNPEHDEPYGKSPPVEEWLVDNTVLNF